MRVLITLMCIVAAGLVAGGPAYASFFDIYAYNNSLSGGTPASTIYLNAGDHFTITVAEDDLWSAGEGPRISNANGLTGIPPYGGADFGYFQSGSFSFRYGALIGQIGNGDYFFVGTSYDGFAPQSGTLKFVYWDSNNHDNFGYVTANVNIVPIPAAAWLLGSGLVGLIGLRRRVGR